MTWGTLATLDPYFLGNESPMDRVEPLGALPDARCAICSLDDQTMRLGSDLSISPALQRLLPRASIANWASMGSTMNSTVAKPQR